MPSQPELPSRDDLLARAFIEAGYTAPDRRDGDGMREASYWFRNNCYLLRLSLGGSEAAKAARAAQGAARRRDEFDALLFLQFVPLVEATRAMRNFCRRLDAIGYEAAFEEFMLLAVAPSLAALPPDASAALEKHLEQLNEAAAAMVRADPPPQQSSNRPDTTDPNIAGQAG